MEKEFLYAITGVSVCRNTIKENKTKEKRKKEKEREEKTVSFNFLPAFSFFIFFGIGLRFASYT